MAVPQTSGALKRSASMATQLQQAKARMLARSYLECQWSRWGVKQHVSNLIEQGEVSTFAVDIHCP